MVHLLAPPHKCELIGPIPEPPAHSPQQCQRFVNYDGYLLLTKAITHMPSGSSCRGSARLCSALLASGRLLIL